MCTSGVAVTPSNVLRAVREVEKWWGTLGLRDWLYIPESKEEEIRHNFPDEMDQKKQSMTYWINTDPLASWRRLITVLDTIRETKVADSIRSNAEPLTGNHTLLHVKCTLYFNIPPIASVCKYPQSSLYIEHSIPWHIGCWVQD